MGALSVPALRFSLSRPCALAAAEGTRTVANMTKAAARRSTLEYLAVLRRLRQENPILASLDDAAWSILLETYRAEISGRRLTVSKLATVEEASPTTAWRRVRAMDNAGLLEKKVPVLRFRKSAVSRRRARPAYKAIPKP